MVSDADMDSMVALAAETLALEKVTLAVAVTPGLGSLLDATC